MKDKTFQLVVLAVFGILAIVGVLFLALAKVGGNADGIGQVVIWGTVDRVIMQKQLSLLRDIDERVTAGVSYVEKDSRTFTKELVEALAAGEGPDIFLLRQDEIVQQRNKLFITSYDSFSLRRFKDTYIEEAELFLEPDGIIAFPYIIDPMILYWNRDILSREGIAVPPEFWDEFFTLSPQITKRDQLSNILQATVALGEYRNINHAKDILSILMIQAGNPIVKRDNQNILQSRLTDQLGFTVRPAESALRFYTEFSNPVKSVYSWNRALPDARTTFLTGDLTFYFGFASELPELRRANPNLNFDIALLPQAREDGVKATFGKMYGFAITQASPNKQGSLQVAALLTSDVLLSDLTKATGLPPVSRRLLSIKPSDAIGPILYDSALISRAWLDPNNNQTDELYKEMIESITSGRLRVSEALGDANLELRRLLEK